MKPSTMIGILSEYESDGVEVISGLEDLDDVVNVYINADRKEQGTI